MKTRNLIGLLLGTAFVTLAPVTWAAGHGGGGGGGFHGGGFGGGGSRGSGFGGGGFHGGGFGGFHGGALAAPRVGGGVGSRGGGVGFGGSRSAGGVPNFAGAGSRFSSFGRPSSRQPAYEGRPDRSVTPNIAHNDGAMPSATRPSQTLTPRALSGLRSHIAERHDGNWHSNWNRGRAHFDHGRFFVFSDGFWFGLDPGLFPWDYLSYYANDYYPYDYYTDVDPYDNNGATYNIAPADSATIQAVQTQLLSLGYYNGSIDGVFGPSTRDAVARYQIANHLNVTGSLSPDTIQSLGVIQPTAS